MEAMLAPGQLVELVIGAGDHEPLRSRFEGIESGLAWFAAPEVNGQTLQPLVGSGLKVIWRGPHGLYWFTSEVVAHRSQPQACWGLAHPSVVNREQRRSFARVSLWLVPQQVQLASGKAGPQRVEATVADLSAGGVRLYTRQHLPLGARVRLRLALWPIEGVVSLVGEVVRVGQRPGAESKPYEVGVRFVDPNPRDTRLLARYVLRQQAEWIRKGLLGL